MTRLGAPFVTQVGTTVMLRWHADNWDSLQLVSCHIYLPVCVATPLLCVCVCIILYINTHTRIYHTTSNLTDVSNYSDSFPNYFLTSKCTVHSKFLELVVLSVRTRCNHNVKLTAQSQSQMYQVSFKFDSYFIHVYHYPISSTRCTSLLAVFLCAL